HANGNLRSSPAALCPDRPNVFARLRRRGDEGLSALGRKPSAPAVLRRRPILCLLLGTLTQRHLAAKRAGGPPPAGILPGSPPTHGAPAEARSRRGGLRPARKGAGAVEQLCTGAAARAGRAPGRADGRCFEASPHSRRRGTAV